MKRSRLIISRFFILLVSLFFLVCAGIALSADEARIGALINILQDRSKNSNERAVAALQLGVEGEDSDVAARVLVEALRSDSDADVRKSAARGLGAVGLPNDTYIQALIDTLTNDDSPAVRIAAVEGLTVIGRDSATAAQALKNTAENDGNATVRQKAAQAFKQITSD